MDKSIRFVNEDPFDILKKKCDDDIKKNMKYIDNEILKILANNEKITQDDLDNLITNKFGNTKKGIFLTYGEVTSDINLILNELDIDDTDILYDLGSGEGKFCMDVWKEAGIKCIGIEYIKERYDKACERQRHEPYVTFINCNFLDYSWDDATIIYMCCTCYDEITISKIVDKSLKSPDLKYIISLKEISDKYYGLFDIKIIKINVTWTDDYVPCYIYKYKNKN